MIELLKPKVFVELGTHKGDSYCAFCQSVKYLNLETKCYAIDTWEGDEHAGYYGFEVFKELKEYHDPLYGSFSKLVQSTFDQASEHFSENSIDLLHIDGLHKYQDVKHDFEIWLPKMTKKGIILFHDTIVRERGFEVWKLWQELKDIYINYEFKYGNGLGIIIVGSEVPEEVNHFLNLISKDDNIAELFFRLGFQNTLKYNLLEQEKRLLNIINEKDKQILIINNDRIKLSNNINTLSSRLLEREETLRIIYHSIGWKFLSIVYKIIDILIPVNSFRRKFAIYSLNNIRLINKSINHIKLYGLRQFIIEIKMRFFHVKKEIPKKEESMESKELINSKEKETIPIDGISVIIPTKNAGTNFEDLLKMIKSQLGIKNIEIVIVDSGSNDNTLDIAKDFGAKIIEIAPEKFSHSYARNLGSENAIEDYLLFTVQDALLIDNLWLYRMLSFLKNNNLTAVSCAEMPRPGADLFYKSMAWSQYKFLDVIDNDKIMSKPDNINHLNLRKNGQLSDIACLISKDIFSRYRYRFNYAEDLNFGIRLIKEGHKIGFLGKDRIIHSHNRPAYYYLKRGYVGHISLSLFLEDFPIPKINFDDFIKDIIFTYNILNKLFQNNLYFNKMCKVSKIEDIKENTIKYLEISMNEKYPSSINIIDNNYIDDDLKSFLKILFDEYAFYDHSKPYNGILIKQTINFINMISDYMISEYNCVGLNEYIIEELKFSIFKNHALLIGSHLAYCYLNNKNSQIMKKLNKELVKGI